MRDRFEDIRRGWEHMTEEQLFASCVTPTDTLASGEERLCGLPATTERTVEGLVCPLCAGHAAEIDRERAVS